MSDIYPAVRLSPKVQEIRNSIHFGDNLKLIKLDNTNSKKGEGFYLDLDNWEELPCHVRDDDTIGIGRPYSKYEVKVYIQYNNLSEVEMKENIIIFPYDSWIDYRSPRGETKYQQAKMRGDTGTIYIVGEKVLNARVFTPKRESNEL